jgi:hypothetical protein
MSYTMGTVKNKEQTMKQTSLEDSWSVVEEGSNRSTYLILAVISAISLMIIVVASLGWLNP